MRVMLLTEFYPPLSGGTEFHVQALAHELLDRGHEVHVVALSPGSFDERLPVHHVNIATSMFPRAHESPKRPFHPPFADPVVRASLRRLIDEIRPDVIHAHNWIVASIPARRRPAVVFTAHDFGLVCARRDLFIEGKEPCSGPRLPSCLVCSSHQYGAIRGPALAVVTPWGRRRVDVDIMIAVSDAVAIRLGPYLKKPFEIIPNFIPDKLPDSGGKLPVELPTGNMVMYAGASGPGKGLEVLAQAWNGGAGFRGSLVLAVLGDRQISPPPRAIMMSLSRPEVVTAWQRATVAVVPSRWAEPCPTVALEAMATGTPIVASAVGGITQLISDGRNGLLVAPGDANALRNAIRHLLESPETRSRLAAEGQRTVAGYRASQVVPKIEEVYCDAIAKAGRRGFVESRA
jgi:glycosyltransferase involved in cell wall biosynthesis